MKRLQEEEPEEFKTLMKIGRVIQQLSEKGGKDEIRELLMAYPVRDRLFWHISQSLKKSVGMRDLKMVRFYVEELGVDLKHQAFECILHFFIWNCKKHIPFKEENDECIILQMLLDERGKVDECDSVSNNTPIHIATETGNLTFVNILISKIILWITVENKADFDAINDSNLTPLAIAQKNNKLEQGSNIVELLKKHGATL